MKKILVANLASPANPGDQAILKGTLKLFREVWEQPAVTLSTRAFSEKAVYEACGCRVVPSYPDVDCLSMDDSLGKMMRIPQALFRPGLLRSAVRESDAVFLAGGAYFYSYRSCLPGLTYLAHLSAACWGRRFHKPVILLPQSYGPFRSGLAKKFFDDVVAAAKTVFYREEITGNFLKREYPAHQKKFHFLPDLALFLTREELLGASALPPRGRTIGVTLRPWEAGKKNVEDYIRILSGPLYALAASENAKVRIIVQVQDRKRGEGDEAVSRLLETRLKSSLGPERVEFCTAQPYFGLPDLCRLYAECDLMISMRLHSALLSYVVGTPAVVAGYQHKAEGILKSLGLEGLYLGGFDELEDGAFKNQLEAVWKERAMWSERIAQALAKARMLILSRFKELAA
ncbi:MAG TPA: polysaccharide pyruvyl transferase family protein [Verrucomicrobiae bacterium]|jgi:polysaccharide pyruvyl transferase WcaK-like protein|nr:polysaccharide pyruvyl transferase family protein [Verrucomicrobiae bacterium]